MSQYTVTVLCIKCFFPSFQFSCSAIAFIFFLYFSDFFVVFLYSSLPFLHLQHVGATLGSCGLAWTAWRRPAATSALASTLLILSGEWASSQPTSLTVFDSLVQFIMLKFDGRGLNLCEL